MVARGHTKQQQRTCRMSVTSTSSFALQPNDDPSPALHAGEFV